MKQFFDQFAKPIGFLGKIAGWLMVFSNRELNRWGVSLLDLQEDDVVLEIGFGPGIAIQEISRVVTKGRIVGIDHSEEMVREATKRNRQAVKEQRVELRHGSIESLENETIPFDKILAVNSIPFWKEPVKQIQKLKNMLQPDGRMVIVLQPRTKGATDETAREEGEKLAEYFFEAGFDQVEQRFYKLKPVQAVAVIGYNKKAI